MNVNEKTYSERVAQFETQLNHLKKQNRLVSFARLILFIIAIGLSVSLKEQGALCNNFDYWCGKHSFSLFG